MYLIETLKTRFPMFTLGMLQPGLEQDFPTISSHGCCRLGQVQASCHACSFNDCPHRPTKHERGSCLIQMERGQEPVLLVRQGGGGVTGSGSCRGAGDTDTSWARNLGLETREGNGEIGSQEVVWKGGTEGG